MDKQAIEQLQQAETLKVINSEIGKTPMNYPGVVLPDGFSLQTLESQFSKRFNYRGKFKTSDMMAFIDYIIAFDDDGSKCFVSPDNMSAKCILDIGEVSNPGRCEHTTQLTLAKTSEYSTVLEFNETKCGQKTLAEFMEDWREYITPYTGSGEAIPVIKAIAGIRKITIDSSRSMESNVQDFSESKSAMERMEAKSSEGIPAGFIFTCQPYTCLSPYRFDFRLSIITSGDKVELVVRIKMLEKIKEEMTKEFSELIKNYLVSQKTAVFIGDGFF